MKLLLLTLLVSVFASSYAGWFYEVDGCDSCCYPPPPKCCIIPPVSTTAPPPPPTTSNPIDCPCVADVVFIMDRTGSVEPEEFNNLRNHVVEFLDAYADPDCFRTSAIAFSEKAPAAYGLSDPAATDPIEAADLIWDIDAPSGNTDTGGALLSGKTQFKNNPPPTPRCRAYVMYTDGGSEDKADTLAKAVKVNNAVPDARMCLIGMQDPGAQANQITNRLTELGNIVASFNSGMLVDDVDFSSGGNISSTLIDDIAACVCDCIPPSPTTAPPPPPTTTTPPLDCDSSADVVFVFDRTGSVEGDEVTNAVATARGVVDLMDDEDFDCFRVAGVQFANQGETLFNFFAADTAEDTKALINVDSPSGDTDTGKGIIHARIALEGRGTPPLDDTCKVVVLFTDGGSENKADTLAQAANLKDKTSARVCVVEMVDVGATSDQDANRVQELEDIVTASWGGFVIQGGDFTLGVPAGIIDDIFACITDPCDGQPTPP